ncbi:MAG: translation initiation factor IF-2 [Nanoarchaeota archaeon]
MRDQSSENRNLRSPIVSVVGHVDHGKTSILDCFRGSSIQEKEAGGITQKISFTKYPLEQIKKACSLIEKNKIKLEITGFLFIDTPGHAAFTNLRKLGGSLADLAILVVNIKEGIKPQTAEVLQILKAHKTPFVIALNKIDNISGWRTNSDATLKESVESQAINVSQEYQQALLTFQGALSEHGFDSDVYYDVSDFTKKVAIVPCSARTKEGIPEILLVLCGLSQKFLREELEISEEAKGVILEIKKEKGLENVEAILYDGVLNEGDEVVIASLDNEPIVSKVRAIEEIENLSFKYKKAEFARAATGIRMHLTNKEGVLSGMPFEEHKGDIEKVKESLKKEIKQSLKLDKQGIIAKADSLGSLEALMILLKQENIEVVKVGIGLVGKTDVVAAKANLEINPLNAVIIGFNTGVEEELNLGKIKLLRNDVIYKLIEELKEWRKKKQEEIERERLLSLSTICKIEILHNHVFRNLNPAIFGARVLGGILKTGLELISENNEKIARVKTIQKDKESIKEAKEGEEVAIALPGVNFERRLKDAKYLYSNISEKEFKKFKENKDLLSRGELNILQEVQNIKEREEWRTKE